MFARDQRSLAARLLYYSSVIAAGDEIGAMVQEQGIPRRARQSALVLLAALAIVLAVHLAIGLSDVLLYGFVGGLVGSLVVLGLDLLRNAGRAAERALPAPDEAGEAGEGRP